MKRKDYSKPTVGLIIDRLGIIQREAQALIAEDKRLRDQLKKKYGPGVLRGAELFDAVVSMREEREVDVERAFKFLRHSEFFEVASVSIEKLEAVVSEPWRRKMLVTVGSKKVVTVLPKGRRGP